MSRSKSEFLSKMRISQAEISETSYWLELITELDWADSKQVVPLYQESNELLALFTSIISRLIQKK